MEIPRLPVGGRYGGEHALWCSASQEWHPVDSCAFLVDGVASRGACGESMEELLSLPPRMGRSNPTMISILLTYSIHRVTPRRLALLGEVCLGAGIFGVRYDAKRGRAP
jgi:hypothetical protein